MSAPAVSASDVVDIASDVWQSLVGDAALPSYAPPAPVGEDAVRAWVTIEGSWCGRLQLVCARPTAAAMAAAVLRTAPDQVDLEDLEDVLGELANVVGGAVKSLVPGSSALGLPRVEPAGEQEPDAATVLRVDLVWRGQPVVVSLHALDVTATTSTPHHPDRSTRREP